MKIASKSLQKPSTLVAYSGMGFARTHIIRKSSIYILWHHFSARCPRFPLTHTLPAPAWNQSLPKRSRHSTQTFMGPCAEIWGHRAWLVAENETHHVCSIVSVTRECLCILYSLHVYVYLVVYLSWYGCQIHDMTIWYGCILYNSCKFLYQHLWIPARPAQGGGGSFENRKPIGEFGCCEWWMAEQIHWWIKGG